MLGEADSFIITHLYSMCQMPAHPRHLVWQRLIRRVAQVMQRTIAGGATYCPSDRTHLFLPFASRWQEWVALLYYEFFQRAGVSTTLSMQTIRVSDLTKV